jgi:hypothetical protein
MGTDTLEARPGFDPAKLTEVELVAASPIILAKFCRMVVHTRVDQDDVEIFEGESKPLVLWWHQVEFLQAMMRRRQVVVLKARQLGITWAMAIYALWYAMTHPSGNVMIVSIGERESRAVIRRIKWLYGTLPVSVKKAYPTKRDTAEVIEFAHTEGNALIQSIPSGNAAGRGETTNVLIMDEGAHYEDAEPRMAALMPGAADVGQTILASTAKGLGGILYQTYMGAPSNGWVRMFHNALARPDRDIEWVMRKRAELGVLGPEEYPLTDDEAFVASGKCVFPVSTLRWYLANSVRPPVWRGTLALNSRYVQPDQDDFGPWRVWEWPREDRSYLITADVCGGTGGLDYSTAVIVDIASGDQVAAYRGQPDTNEFTRQIIRAGWFWRGPSLPAVLAPEVNEHGRAVAALIREWRYPNPWYQARFDQRRDIRQREIGWHTSPGTRPILISALQEGLKSRTLGIRDADALAEMEVFVFNPKNNKPEALAGYNDDIVMAWGIQAVLLQRLVAGVKERPPDVFADDSKSGSYWKPIDERTGY